MATVCYVRPEQSRAAAHTGKPLRFRQQIFIPGGIKEDHKETQGSSGQVLLPSELGKKIFQYPEPFWFQKNLSVPRLLIYKNSEDDDE